MDNAAELLDRPRTGKRHIALLVLLVLAVGGLWWTGYRPWKERQNRLYAASARAEATAPLVTAVPVHRGAAKSDLVLPGALGSLLDTPVFARSEGYITRLYVDIGDRVKKGQVLVDIDTPELDEQLRQAQYRYNQFKASIGATAAAVAQAKANLKLAETQLRRTEQLVNQGILSRQELDERQANHDVKVAEKASAEAALEAAEEGRRAVNSDIERLRSLNQYKHVVAPYDGIITVRNCQTGNLVSASSQQSPGRELFRMADPRTLRVFITVPQPDTPAIREGMPAELTVAEFPGRVFRGVVRRKAGALDAATRTLLTEVQIENADMTLLPGMFGQVKLVLERPSAPYTIPGDTLVVRSDGPYAAVVDAAGTVHFRRLTLGRDFGRDVEVLEGLAGGEKLVVSPGDAIQEGVKVRLAPSK